MLEELKRIQSVDIVLPNVDGLEQRPHCFVEHDDALATILDRMQLRSAERLKPA